MQHLKVSIVFIFFAIISANGQYTETINSNRPGESQGAYAVGKNVLQLEAGAYMGHENHILYNSDTDILGASYGLRYGFLTEILELNFFGSFQDQVTSIPVGNSTDEFKTSNFTTNIIGAKFLLFDPNVSIQEREVNLYSWEANQRMDFRSLIPAVSIYAGANFMWWENPYMFEGESEISPKAAVITQQNWGRWVLVMNFIADKFTEEFPSYGGVFTLTHAITPEFAIFGEFQTYISDLYADELVRGGAAYLLSKDFQLDISGLVNFKDTPSRWQVAAGVSFRLDFHEDDEYIEDTYEGERNKNGEKLEETGFYKEDEERKK
ncbi:outer membrane putative beta-barrel porin/alpha-amylase [Salegentibacter sp. 24]|uniref:transporter n=1 Tax=Salegentibacter sp. 24 TaxID=2183986 RepID=UPI00105D9EFE|nr:transporter [Salegentibacter sp. 24]TDN87879.1 outer membrane putative beta-barrel porin/alpha-amylase [Salegentibacter sp. 24]